MNTFKIYLATFLLFFGLSHNVFAEIIIPADVVEGQETGKNYIKNSHFEKTANTVSSYSDSAGTSPVDGTGGTATITCTRTTTNPISGDGSLLITKDAANRQGQGCSIPFTIDRGDRATMQTIVFPYEVASGTFSAGTDTTNSDLTMWVYDVTNSVLIPVQGTGRFYSNSADYFYGYFQTNSNSTSYRLIFHQTLTGTSAYTLKADNVKIFKSKFASGTTISDWKPYTYTGFTSTNGVVTSKWRRVGDTMEVRQNVEWSGAAGAFSGVFGLPSGYSIDTTKLGLGTIAIDRINLGDAQFLDSGAFIYKGFVTYRDTTTVNVWQSDANSSTTRNANLSTTTPFSFAASDTLNISYSVPITGWSSSTQQSDGYDGRLIAATYSGVTTGSIGAAYNTVTYPTKLFDYTNSYSGGVFTVPSSGVYTISAFNEVAGTESLNSETTIGVFVNGSISSPGGYLASVRSPGTVGSTVVGGTRNFELRAGDQVTIRLYTDIGSPSYSSTTIVPHLSINKLQAPATISATEVVALSANVNTTATSFTNATDTVVTGYTVNADTHSAFNTTTGVYTAPVSGLYEVTGLIIFAANSTGYRYTSIYKGGVVYQYGSITNAVTSDSTATMASALIPMLAGETISMAGFQNSGGALTTRAITRGTMLTIKRLK